MPKKIPNEEFEAVVRIVAAHPGGIKIDAIRKGLDIILPVRMLQRRLRRLADEGRIVTKGTGKGKRYFPKRYWGSSLRLTLVKNCQRSNVDLTPNRWNAKISVQNHKG